MHVAAFCRKMILGPRWVRGAHTANASGGTMRHLCAGRHLPPEEEVQQGADAAEPSGSPPPWLPFLGGPLPLRVSDVMQKMHLILSAS